MLIALVGVTAWVVAWVSVWLVPAYLVLIALIFVAPPKRPTATVSSVATRRTADTDAGISMRVDQPAEMAGIDPTGERFASSASAVSQSGAVSDSITAVSSPVDAKPRGARSRARKVSQSVAEPARESSTPTWIRVGPGKFVRADTVTQAVDARVSDESAVVVLPASAPLTTPAMDAPVDSGTSRIDECTLEPEPTAHPIVETFVAPDLDSPGSVPEEYGITPSASDSDPQAIVSVNNPIHAGAEDVAQPERDFCSHAGHDGNTLWSQSDADGLRIRRRTAKVRSGRVCRKIASPVAGMDSMSLRRQVRMPQKGRASVYSRYVRNAQVRQTFDQACGRIARIQRGLRARSPPSRSRG